MSDMPQVYCEHDIPMVSVMGGPSTYCRACNEKYKGVYPPGYPEGIDSSDGK